MPVAAIMSGGQGKESRKESLRSKASNSKDEKDAAAASSVTNEMILQKLDNMQEQLTGITTQIDSEVKRLEDKMKGLETAFMGQVKTLEIGFNESIKFVESGAAEATQDLRTYVEKELVKLKTGGDRESELEKSVKALTSLTANRLAEANFLCTAQERHRAAS